jgi:phosphoglycerate kinase
MNVLNKKSVEDIDVRGKKVLIRCDFNVKMEDGVITSDKRIVASLPTIKYLLDNGAKVSLAHTSADPRVNSNPNFHLLPLL